MSNYVHIYNLHAHTHRYIYMYVWMHAWMDGWMDARMDGWMMYARGLHIPSKHVPLIM